MPKINVDFSVRLEIKRANRSLRRAEFYTKHNYKYSAPNLSNSAPTIREIEDIVERNYSDSEYFSAAEYIRNAWPSVQNESPYAFDDIFPYAPELFEVRITKYGVGGSFDLPNFVYVNKIFREGLGITRTVLHEIIHIALHNMFELEGTPHWTRERIVDLHSMAISKQFGRLQNIPVQSEIIDRSFYDNYPDSFKIIHACGLESKDN